VKKRTAVAAAGLFATTLAWRFLTFAGFTNDHYAHLALAQQLLLGARPVRDFSDPGWPLTYLLSATAWFFAGDAMAVEWALTATALAIGAACTVVVAQRLSGSLLIAILVTVLEILIFPRTYSYPKILTYAVGAWAMLTLAVTPSPRRVVVMAAVIAAAFLLRHDHGLYIGVASALCLALASRADGWWVASRRVAMLTGSVAMFLLPWMLFITLNGGPGAYFETAVEFARAEANASNLKSWPRFTPVPGKAIFGLERPDRPLAQIEWTPDTTNALRETLEERYGLDYVRQRDDARFYYVHNTAADNLRALADDPHVAGSAGLGRVSRPAWREFLAFVSPLRLGPALHSAANADAWLFWLFWSLPVLSLAILCGRALRRHERWAAGEFAAIAALTVTAIFVNAGFLRDLLRTRFSDAVVPAALLGAWLLGLCWVGSWRRRILQRFVQGLTVAILTVSVAAISAVSEMPERISRTGIGEGLQGIRARAAVVSPLLRGGHRQGLAPPSRYSEALLPFFAYLDRCSSRSDRLIVTGEFPDVVVLAGRGFAGDGVVFGAWYSSVIRQDRTLERLRARPALFALMIDTAAFRARFPRIDAYVTEEYKPMAEVAADGAGTVSILVHRDRTPVGVDPGTGWPCFPPR
jgi:hypothetical protein